MARNTDTPANAWHRQREKQRAIAREVYGEAEELSPEEVKEMED